MAAQTHQSEISVVLSLSARRISSRFSKLCILGQQVMPFFGKHFCAALFSVFRQLLLILSGNMFHPSDLNDPRHRELLVRVLISIETVSIQRS